MSSDKDDLIPEFRTKVDSALAALANEGLRFKPYFTLRDPVVQAQLWRQSRSTEEVNQQIQELKDARCDFMIACFDKAGPSSGPWRTNAIPGLSWHQYGEAVDCFLEDAQGSPIWESKNYGRFGQVGDAHGMWWGGHFGDSDHWQNRRIEPPAAFGTLKQINDALEFKWQALV
jgi:peptidoglycan L-alanyl-D-glutamate endopeptidase CwlK